MFSKSRLTEAKEEKEKLKLELKEERLQLKLKEEKLQQELKQAIKSKKEKEIEIIKVQI